MGRVVGGRREEERTGLRLNAGKRLVRSYGGGFGGGSLSAAMAFMLAPYSSPHAYFPSMHHQSPEQNNELKL